MSAFLPLLAACAGTTRYPAGRWVQNLEVRSAFLAAQVFPEHAYYYVGSRQAPDGVIAIDRRFRLRAGKVWAHIDVDESVLQNWVRWWQAVTFHHCHYNGGYILAPNGEKLGYWYSPFAANQVWMSPEGELIVALPHSVEGRTNCEREGREFYDIFSR